MYVLISTRTIDNALNFQQYAQPVTKKGKSQTTEAAAAEPKKLSNHAQRNLDEKKKGMLAGRKVNTLS